MQLEHIDVVLRPRNRWEAIDLGMQLARRNFLSLWLLWWLSALPVTVLMIVLLRDYPSWISSAVWWFKPLFEPILVYWLGRALFGERLSLRESAGHWWQVSRGRLLANLLWRRLSPNRSLLMPVSVLEGPDPRAWRVRVGVLLRQFGGGGWLTVIGVHFELVITLGLVFGALLLVPREMLPHWRWWEWIADSNRMMEWMWAVASVLAMSVIAPFYVAGGFALYLSRRTELEAWDIELDFRRLLRRLAPAGASLAVLLLLPSLLLPRPAMADSQREQVAQIIDQVLADQDFGSKQTLTRWEWKHKDDQRKQPATQLDLGWLADSLQVLAWVGITVLVAWLVAQLYRHREQLRVAADAARSTQGSANVSPEAMPPNQPLPSDIAAAVHDCLVAGDARAATALLYRASVSVLVQRYALALQDSDTEGRCLARVQAQRPAAEGEYFARLTRTWIGLAYAERSPPQARVQQLLDEWRVLYGATEQRG